MSASLLRLDAVLVEGANLPFFSVPLELDEGMHALVADPSSGLFQLAPVMCGQKLPRSGTARVRGLDPYRVASVRKQIGSTFQAADLPSLGSVETLLATIGAGLGTPANSVDLPTQLRGKMVSDLTAPEARAVELALALMVPSPALLVLTEPLLDPLRRADLIGALAQRARNGACVVILTSSLGDALELGCRVYLVERGNIAHTVGAGDIGQLAPGNGVELRVQCDLPRLMFSALAEDPAVSAARFDAKEKSLLCLRGDHLDRLALAVARASLEAGVRVESIAPVTPGLDEVRAAAAGLALASYHAAYRWVRGDKPSSAPPVGPSTAEGRPLPR